MKYLLARYRKAIMGALGAGALAIAGALFITSPGTITDAEWFLIVSAAVGGAGGPAVSKPNAPKRKQK